MTRMNRTTVQAAAALIVFLLVSGCSSMFTNERAVSLQDVVYLSRHGLSNDVIMKHIERTGSRFDVTTDDLVTLKQEGVDDEVIAYLVEHSGPQPPFASEYERPIFPGMDFYYHPPVPYYEVYIPVFESHTGYYPPYQTIYTPQVRRSGLLGRFYEPPEWSRETDRGRRTGESPHDKEAVDRAGRNDDDEEAE